MSFEGFPNLVFPVWGRVFHQSCFYLLSHPAGRLSNLHCRGQSEEDFFACTLVELACYKYELPTVAVPDGAFQLGLSQGSLTVTRLRIVSFLAFPTMFLETQRVNEERV
eukprot:gene18239-biopygen5304